MRSGATARRRCRSASGRTSRKWRSTISWNAARWLSSEFASFVMPTMQSMVDIMPVLTQAKLLILNDFLLLALIHNAA